MRHRLFATVGMICLATVSAMMQSCDPQKATLELFRRQGLNLLKPARDYIQIGGVVVRHGGGPLEYIDPIPDVRATVGGGRSFKAMILAETTKKTAKAAVVLSAIKSILPGAVDLTVQGDTELKLDQIDATGLRLNDAQLTRLVAQEAVTNAITGELKQGLDAWIVQEVYSASQMRVSAATAAGLNVKFAGGGDLPDCSAANKDAGKDATGAGDEPKEEKPTEEKPAAKPADKPAGGGATAKEQQPGSTSKAGGKPSEPASGQTPTQKEEKKAPAAAAAAPPKFSVGLGVCRSGNATLSFTSPNAGESIPFAVRLKRVALRGGRLVIVPGEVAPGATLGPRGERFTLIDPNEPVVAGLQRRQPR